MVQARKHKSKLNKAKRAELKSKNTDVLSGEEMQQLGDELLHSIVDGFSKELNKSSPAIKKLAKSNEALIQEFFLGVKDGIKAEINAAVQDGMRITKNLSEAPDSNAVMDEVLEFLKKNNKTTEALNKTIVEKEKTTTNNNNTDHKITDKSSTDTQNNEKSIYQEKEKTTLIKEFKETLKKLFEKQAKVITEVTRDEIDEAQTTKDSLLNRNTDSYADSAGRPKTIKEKAQQFATSLMGRAIGVDDEDNMALQNQKKRDSFVRVEQKLNPNLKTKDLKKSWKIINEEKTKLESLEKEKKILEEQGYSKEEINTTLNYDARVKESADKVAQHDPREQRRREAEKNTPTTLKDFPQDNSNPLNPKSATPVTTTPRVPSSNSDEIQEEAKEQKEASDQIQKDQLSVLTQIKDILSRGSPKKDGEAAPTEEKSGGGLLSTLADAATSIGGKGKGLLSKISPKMLKIGGAALAVGAGAYTAYSSFNEADDKTKEAVANVKAMEESGQITKEEAAKQLKVIDDSDNENKSGAVGKGAGLTAGAIGGGVAGAKIGAMLGSFVGPAGTVAGGAIGGLAGSAIGAFSGSEVGQNIGGGLGIAYNKTKDFLGFGSPTVSDQPGVVPPNAAVGKETPSVLSTMAKGATAMIPGVGLAATAFPSLASSASNLASSAYDAVAKPVQKALFSDPSSDGLKDMTKSMGNTVAAAVQATGSMSSKTPPPPPADTKIVDKPFNTNIRNTEVSLTDYLRSRYAT